MEKINLYPEKEFACLGCPNAIWQEGKIGVSIKNETEFVICYCQKLHKNTFQRNTEETVKPFLIFTKCQAKEDFLREIIDKE